MAELRETHLRYLLAIYELGKSMPDVGIQAVAKAMNCSKASVTKMMDNLMERDLLVRERYGKIYLTDTGFLLPKELFRCVEVIRERLPAMGFELTEEDMYRIGAMPPAGWSGEHPERERVRVKR